MTTANPVYGEITGPVVMIGLGSIGRGTIPLIERHLKFDKNRFFIIDPLNDHQALAEKHGAKFIQAAVTQENYKEFLTPLLTEGEGQGFCINLSVDTSSLDIMKLCRELDVLYIDTVVEPWPGFYFSGKTDNANRTNYALRETVRTEKYNNPGGTTAVSTCGANPGMVSWFVKEALLNIAADVGIPTGVPQSRDEWAKLMQKVGVKGIHIAERDTQSANKPKPMGTFVNTWSVEGFLSEGFQPAELGWGTHEKWMPPNAHKQKGNGCRAAIWLEQPGCNTKVRSWCPTPGPQWGFLVTHNESVSIADYYTVGAGLDPEYRPTCHYAYHPANDAVLSLHETLGTGENQVEHIIMDETNIVEGIDELGVLLYGHAKNAYWFGSRLSIEEARTLAPYQNATGMQVTSAVLAGIVWALENPKAGIVEADEMDHIRCLEIQRPYLGPVEGHYTDWNPLKNRRELFEEEIDTSDPWQFKNVLVR
jgi:homospermidine synthase